MNWGLGSLRYGEAWRQSRRAFHQFFNANAVPKYYPIMIEETKDFLRKLKSNPEQVFEGLQLYVRWNAIF